MERLSSLFALNDLFQAHHGARWNNTRLYYNPINNVFEPISFDAQIGFFKTFLACNSSSELITSYAPYFEDEDFYKLYMSKLIKYGNTLFFKSIIDKYNKDIDKISKLINSEWPEYEFDYNSIYKNINFIRSILKPGNVTSSKLSISKSKLNLSIANLQILPITNVHLKFPNSSKISAKNNFIINGKKQNEILEYVKVEMERSDFRSEDEYVNVKLGFQIIGLDSVIYEEVKSINAGEDNIFSDLVYKNLDLNNLDFISEIPETNELTFKNGSHVINADIYIPENKFIFIPSGTKLDFINNCYIYSRSPIQINGGVDSPIVLFSSDSSGGGILLDRAKGISSFEYVYVKNFGKKNKNERSLTGVITANESKIELRNCYFSMNRSEDALNIIRSNFKLENCTFLNNHNDAIDLDFSKGNIINSYFFKSGNDAIDCSGSEIYLENIVIDYALDKAVSAG